MTDNLKLTDLDLTVKCDVVSTVADRMSAKFFILIEEEEEVCMSPEEILFHLMEIQERIKSQMAPHLQRIQ
ncbi:MAG: hypothetical protein VW124_27440 [Paracoccaceae bacterium]